MSTMTPLSMFGREIKLKRHHNRFDETFTKVIDAVTGEELPIPVIEYHKSEEEMMNAIMDQVKNSKFEDEDEQNFDLMNFVENRVMSSNPVVALPKEWPSPVQTLFINLPAGMYSEGDKDVVKVGDVMKSSQDANAMLSLALFVCEVVHKSIVGMEDAKPKKKKKNGRKNRDKPESEKIDEGEDEEEEDNPALLKDRYVRQLGEKGDMRQTWKYYGTKGEPIDIPKILPLIEKVVNRNLDTIAHRLVIYVFEKDYDINEAAEEMLRRIHMQQTDHDEKQRTQITKGGPEPFCKSTDYTCFRKIYNMTSLSEVLQKYYGHNHVISRSLRQYKSELDSGESLLSNEMCKARLTDVLSLENCLSHPLVQDACAVQKNIDRYTANNYPRRFPLPHAVHVLDYSDVEPKKFYNTRYPVSVTMRLYKDRIIQRRRQHLEDTFSEPDCDFRTYHAIETQASQLSPADEAGMLAAGISKADPSLRSIRDELLSLDILECKADYFMNQRQMIESGTHEVGSVEYLEKMNDFKTRSIGKCWELFQNYMSMPDLFSPAYISAMNHVGQTNHADHWGDWFLAARNLDPHANILLMLMHRLTKVYNVKRGSQQRALLTHYFSMLSSAHPHDGMKVNILAIDSNSTGKSFLLQQTGRLGLEGTVQNLSHVTANAMNVRGNRNGITIILEEMNPAMLGIGPNGKNQSSEFASNIKNMITNQRTVSIRCHFDENGISKSVISVQPVRGAIQGAMNHQMEPNKTGKAVDQSAELSRFLISQPNPVYRTEGEASMTDLVCTESTSDDIAYKKDFELQMHTFHAYYIIINMMIGCSVLHSVNNDLGAVVVSELNRRLEENGVEKMTTRMCEMVRELMVAICTFCAIVICTASEHSLMFRMDETGNPMSFRPEVIREIEKLLVVNSQHVMMAITLITSNIVPLARQQITEILWHNRSEFNPRKYVVNHPTGQIEDPRYDLLETNGLDSLASFISDRCEADISTQAVKNQIQALFHMSQPGIGPKEVHYKSESGFFVSDEDKDKERQKQAKTHWNAKLIDIPHDKTMNMTKRFNHIIVLKDWYDPERIKARGKKSVGEDWLANEVADILSHSKTEPKILVHAGVLRRPAKEMVHGMDYEPIPDYIQSAMGVVLLKKNPNWGLRYIRSTHSGMTDDTLKYNTRRRYHLEQNNRQPYSVFASDHDLTFMMAHHARIGVKPDMRLLPKYLHIEMLIAHDRFPGYFGHQDANAWEIYPRDFVADFDVTKNTYKMALDCPYTEQQIEDMRTHSSLRHKLFYVDLVENVEKEWEDKQADFTRITNDTYDNLRHKVLRRDTMTGKFNGRGFTDSIAAQDIEMVKNSIPDIPKAVQLDEHLAESALQHNRKNRRNVQEEEAEFLGVDLKKKRKAKDIVKKKQDTFHSKDEYRHPKKYKTNPN